MKKDVIKYIMGFLNLLKMKSKGINIIAIKYGYLSIKHKLQGWCPRMCSIKYAETIETKLTKKINLR